MRLFWCLFVSLIPAASLAAPTATVTVHPAQVTHPDARLLLGMSFDARTSFEVSGVPVGYYSPIDGSPLPIGTYWETSFRLTALRFPQGPVNQWDWKKTVDPFRSGQPLLGNRVARFGLDELLELAVARGIPIRDLTIMVNIYRDLANPDFAGAVADAVDLVRYLNEPWDGTSFDGTNWEAVRAANGYPEPWGVEVFHLGNEPWAAAEYDFLTTGAADPAEDGALQYAAVCANLIAAMRAVDPTIRITLAGPSPRTKPADQQKVFKWNQTLLDELGDTFDAIVMNTYPDSLIPAMRGVGQMEVAIDQVTADLASYNAAHGTDVALVIGEHAHAIQIDYTTFPPTNLNPDFAMQWQGAVTTADFLAMVSGKAVERAHFFIYGNSQAVWHPIRYDGKDAQGGALYTVMPAARLYEVLGPEVLDEAVAVTSVSPMSSDANPYSVRGMAFRSSDGAWLTVVLVNRDPGVDHVVGLEGLDGWAFSSGTLLFASTPTDEQVSEQPVAPTPDGAEVAVPRNGVAILRYGLDAASCPAGDLNLDGFVNVVDVQCGVLLALHAANPTGQSPICLAAPAVEADLGCDGTIDVIDVQGLILRALGLPLGGDLDADGCPDACD
jgi:hypothetical protein